ncbi:MAG: LamG domain-containing protein, partial [Bdellovibrionota bacterium]
MADAWGSTADVTITAQTDSLQTVSLIGRWDSASATANNAFPTYARCVQSSVRDMAGANNATLKACDGHGFTGSGVPGSPFSISLDGSDDYLATELRVDYAALPATTWEAWVHPTRMNHNARQWIMANGINTAYNRGLFILESTYQIVAGVNNVAPYWNSGVTLTSDAWAHLAVVYDTTDVKVYKNGVPVSQGGIWGTTSSTYGLHIGSIAAGGSYYKGRIGQVAAYSRALKPSEVAVNCQSLKSRYDSSIVCGAADIGAKNPRVYANSSITFDPSQGQTPYTYSIVSGGGSIGASTGAFTAPGGADSTVVRLTDSQGYTSDATITTDADAVTSSSLVARWDGARASVQRSFPSFLGCVINTWKEWTGGYNGSLLSCEGGASSGFKGTGTSSDAYRFTFDGSNDSVTTAVDIDYGAMNTATIETWIYPTRVNHTAAQWVVSNSNNTASGRGFNIKTSASTVNVGINNNTSWDSGAAITANAWNHVVVAYEAADVKIYVNGT